MFGIEYDYKFLENKYDIHVKYPGKSRKNALDKIIINLYKMIHSCKAKLHKYIPFVKEEWTDAECLENSFQNVINSVEDSNKEYIKLHYVHMYDYIPKEKMKSLQNELEHFRAKNVKDILANEMSNDELVRLKSFKNNKFKNSKYSWCIKKDSPLYKYVDEIHIGFQDLTTSMNIVVYSVVLKSDIVEKLNQIFVGQVDNYVNYFRNKICGIGKVVGDGSCYKASFIEECIEGIKWNIVKLMKKNINFYCIDNKKKILPSINVYRTNIPREKEKRVWKSILINYPEYVDYIDGETAWINWFDDNKNINCYYLDDSQSSFCSNGSPFFIRYYFSKLIIEKNMIEDTYLSIGEIMDQMSRLKKHNIKIKNWLYYRVKMYNRIYYAQRLLQEKNELKDGIKKMKNYVQRREGKIHLEDVIYVLEKDIVVVENALNQTLVCINNVIEYELTKSNFKIQVHAVMIALASMIIAAVALVVSVH